MIALVLALMLSRPVVVPAVAPAPQWLGPPTWGETDIDPWTRWAWARGAA